MVKSDYFMNSAKLLALGSALLFIANLTVYLGAFNETALTLGGKLSTFSFYAFLIIGFLAFNGEGVAYKKLRQLKNKRVTNGFKLLLFAAFFIRYLKKIVEFFLLKADAQSLLGSFTRIFLGLFNTAASYGFVLFAVSIWYLRRDKAFKKLFPIELTAVILGGVYNFYKAFNYSVTKYSLTYFGEGFTEIFSNTNLLHIFCLLQFLFDFLMFVAVVSHYKALSLIDDEKSEKIRKNLVFARKIYNPQCVGLDTMEDDLLLNLNEKVPDKIEEIEESVDGEEAKESAEETPDE